MKTLNEVDNLEEIIKTAKSQGASSVEVIRKTWSSNPVSFENNKLKSLESNESSAIAIRLIKNNKIGIASSTDPSALPETITSAIDASIYGPEATFEFSKEKITNPDYSEKNETPFFPLEDLVKRGDRTIKSLVDFHPDILVSGGFGLSYGESLYLNSNGVYGKKNKTVYDTGFYINLIRQDDFLGISEGNSSLEDFPQEEEIKNKIYEKLKYSLNHISLDTKKYTVIFSPNAVSSIFSSIFNVVLNGKAIQQGISPLVGKIGEKLFDDKLSYVEDPMFGVSRTHFDDEGIQTVKKHLIKDGVINSFYFDLSTASKMNILNKTSKFLSTGNGFKGGMTLSPSPSLTGTSIEPGKKLLLKDLIKNTKEGIFVDHLLGAGQSNTLAGEFNVGIELGFKIENGEIKGRVKNCMLAGNIFDILKNITEISKDSELIYGSDSYPAFLIDGMTVSGKAEN